MTKQPWDSLEKELLYYADLMAYVNLIRKLDAIAKQSIVVMEDLTGIGKLAEQAPELTKELREVFREFAIPIAKEAGGLSADWIRGIRERNAIRGLIKTQKLINKHQKLIEPKTVEVKVLQPIVDKMSLEEDDYLRDKWASLLASGMLGEKIHPSYISILADLDALDAKYLENLKKIKEQSESAQYYKFSESTLLKEMAQDFNIEDLIERIYLKKKLLKGDAERFSEAQELLSQSTDNLKRLQLIVTEGERKTRGDMAGGLFIDVGWGYKVDISSLGQRFLNAVSME